MRASTIIVSAMLVGSTIAAHWTLAKPQAWTEEETRLVLSLGLANLPP